MPILKESRASYRFRSNLLEGSAAQIINCLFVENASNLGADIVAKHSGEPAFTNSGVLTIFQNSRALVKNCTFTGNRNAIDDMGGMSLYVNCILADDTLAEGFTGTSRYELDVSAGAEAKGCVIRGATRDPRGCISAKANSLDPPSSPLQPGLWSADSGVSGRRISVCTMSQARELLWFGNY